MATRQLQSRFEARWDTGRFEHVIGTPWNDTITGSYGDDLVEGGRGNDVIHGGFGNDVLRGGDGNDMLFGESGKDTLYGDQGMDALRGGYQNDKLYGGLDNDALFGGLGDDELHGGRQDDVLYGDAGNDILRGGFGYDMLFGGDGDDGLLGGDGRDRLFGQGGADRHLVFDAPSSFDGFVDVVMDSTSADAVVTLVDGKRRDHIRWMKPRTTQLDVQWSSYDIATLDEALAAVHKRTQSTSLLKSNGEPLKLYRYGTTESSSSALEEAATCGSLKAHLIKVTTQPCRPSSMRSGMGKTTRTRCGVNFSL